MTCHVTRFLLILSDVRTQDFQFTMDGTDSNFRKIVMNK